MKISEKIVEKKGTNSLKRGFAKMQKGGVIMDVVNAEQARIAEDAGAVAVMALEAVPADIRARGGVARMADPKKIKEIIDVVTIPVMAKCRIGHFGEAQVIEALGVDMADESEVLTPADEEAHIDKRKFIVPFVCGARNLGEAYMVQGNYTLALKELLKAEKLYAEDPYLQNDLGLTYMAKVKLDLAIDHFKKAVKIKPDYAPAKNNLGTAYLAKEDWDTAIKYFKDIVDDLLYATPHYPLANLGWAYYNKKEYMLAEKFYLQALEIEPRFIIALRGLGRTYINMGKIPEAIKTLEKAVKNTPRFAELYFDLGRAYTLSGNDIKARTAFQKVMELTPDSDLALKAKKEMQKIKK